jgi:hypothetical protein
MRFVMVLHHHLLEVLVESSFPQKWVPEDLLLLLALAVFPGVMVVQTWVVAVGKQVHFCGSFSQVATLLPRVLLWITSKKRYAKVLFSSKKIQA